MKTKYIISLLILSAAVGFSLTLVSRASAQKADIQYPVAELGSCSNESSCKTYCDKPENISPCLDFAEKHNLMSQEELETAKKFVAAGGKGPGGCRNKDECQTFCDDMSHINECVAFAEENGLLPPQELAEAKKVQQAIAKGIKPPACGSRAACDQYCEAPEHMSECVGFAEAAGFLEGKELEDAKKMLSAIERGVKPLPCRGKQSCDQFCSSPDNMEQCITFASEAGFMNEQEKADSQKMLAALKKGVKPPACQGKEACDQYCGQDEHFKECLDFAEAAGFMTADEAKMARKTGGKGPGGCKNQQECETFCNDPTNQQTCFNFAKDNGLLSEEDMKRMEEGKQQFQQGLNQAGPAVIDCLNLSLGNETVEGLRNGSVLPSEKIGNQMRTCFEQAGPPPGQEGINEHPTGPGGCKTPEECQSFCKDNPEECQGFGGQNAPGPGNVPGGQGSFEGQAGPGDCQTPEECQSFCQINPEKCQNFAPPNLPTEPLNPNQGTPQQNNNGFAPPKEFQNPPPGFQPPPNGQFQPPTENQFSPGFNQQLPPNNQFQPGEPQPIMPQAPAGEQAPSTPENPSGPPPSSLLENNSLLGSFVNALWKAFGF